ncbi:MAG: caspase family protein [Nitrospirota bacterium]
MSKDNKYPAKPILRVNTEMHTAQIKRIGIDAKNHFIVTGSEDKTLKVWELSTGELITTLRVPIDDGNIGKIYSVAISPDGKTVACGGWTGYAELDISIYIFDREKGQIKQTITGLPGVILYLTYSKDGMYLAATLFGKNGIRIYETTNYSQAALDSDYGDSSYGADFDNNERLVTSSYDGYIRLYDTAKTFNLIQKEKSKLGNQPFSVAFSPDGSKIAVGFDDTKNVNILSAKDLSHLYSPDTSNVNMNLGNVTFSLVGKYLYAGGRANNNSQYFIRKWSQTGEGSYTDLPASNDTIMQIVPLKDGGIAFGSANQAIGVFNNNDEQIMFRHGDKADFRSNTMDDFHVSKDVGTVRFWYEYKCESTKLFSISTRELIDDSSYNEPLVKPVTQSNLLNITDWKNKVNPKLNGAVIILHKYETSRSLAILPEDNGFILGTEWRLLLFDNEGIEKWEIPVPGIAWNVNVSQDGKLAVAAFGDGTIRWFRVSDGKELLAFFPHNDKKRWILWTPNGYYDASIGAEDLIGWHINRGADKEADFFPISKFRNDYYRPDIISKILKTLDEDEAIKQANKDAKITTKPSSIETKLPPVITILSPRSGAVFSVTDVEVLYEVRVSPNAPVEEQIVFVNKSMQKTEKSVVTQHPESTTYKTTVKIPKRESIISIMAKNKNEESVPSVIKVLWNGETDNTPLKPKLYILAVGINNYHTPLRRLKFASKDAEDFVSVMMKQEGKQYRGVERKLLIDSEATRRNIIEGLEWLQKETTPKDVAMVMLAGHGSSEPTGKYYFLPIDVDSCNIRSTAVSSTEIIETVVAIKGKKIFFMDTCHSGKVCGERKENNPTIFVNTLTSSGRDAVVFMASTKSSYGHSGNGVFTKSVIEGIEGKAEIDKNGSVTTTTLDGYITKRVPELAREIKKTQVPVETV